MLLIYVHRLTPRINYIFKFIFSEILGLTYRFTTDKEEYLQYSGPKFSYTNHPIDNGINFCSRNLLFETGISDQNITYGSFRDIPTIFNIPKKSAFPFDPFAASFFLISRYEEYLPFIKDMYDRFPATESVAYKGNFLKKPVIDIWAYWIADLIKERYPAVQIRQRKYVFQPTIDVDNAFAYRCRGFMRTSGAYIRSLFKLDFKDIVKRTQVLMGFKKDPYDTFDYLKDLHKRHNLKSIYFFLLGDYDVNDKNISYNSRKFQSLIKSISDRAQVGIHPSFASNKSIEKLKTEIQRLSSLLYRDIHRSRQHFLKITFPDTYRNLLDMDITDDYSMGFAREIGFRAGTCTPFLFYDLDLETETKLLIHPFQIMDGTLNYYLKLKPDEVCDYIAPVIEDIKKVNGTLVTLWHNESLSELNEWKGWKNVYEKVVKLALP